jgi:trehalose 6-phosphate synthase/phosphatase
MLRVANRHVRIGAFPMGIDAAEFDALARSRAVESATNTLRATTPQLLVGVDRLDYSKGIPRRLLAFEKLLSDHPELRNRIRLVQVAVPSRHRVRAYQRLRREVEQLVGRVNGSFGTPTWTPIHYIHAGVSPETLVALYRAATAMLVTPVRDGMNLVAKEFVASRFDCDGVLILSEFAGAARELTAAVQIHPYDVAGLADAMYAALTMSDVERRRRMKRMRDCVLTHDVHAWAAGFLSALTS